MKSQETKRCTLYCTPSQPVHYNAMLILLSVRGAAQGPSPHRLGTGLMRIIQRKQGSCCPATACRVPGCPHCCLEPGSGKTSSLLLHVPMTHLGAVRCWTCGCKSFHPLGVLVYNRKAKSRYPLSSGNTLSDIICESMRFSTCRHIPLTTATHRSLLLPCCEEANQHNLDISGETHALMVVRRVQSVQS